MITSQLSYESLGRTFIKSSRTLKYFHSFHHGHQLFDELAQRTNVSPHHSMLKCLHQNRQSEALDIFKKHVKLGLSNIDEVAIAVALKACRGQPKLGYQIHGFALTSGFLSHLSVSNSLMNMYSKSDEFGQALTIFNSLDNPDIVSWNTVLSGFENVEDALSFACRMHSLGVVFEAVTYTAALAHCTDHEEFRFGTQLHCHVLKFGLESEIFIGNALITMYSKWGRIVEAEIVFYKMPKRDIVSWNAMVSGYSQEGGFGLKAMWAFKEMTREDMKLDHVSLTSVVSACGQERDLKLGRQVHGLAIKMGYRLHVSVCNCLMTLYSRCDVVKDAKLVFENMVDRNVISWTTMLSINEEDAVILFNKMRVDGVYPNEVTFVGLIHAITIKNMVKEGLMVHGFCIKTSFFPKLVVANSFITMYAKFELMKDSTKVFEELDYREIISWNAIISGYAQNGLCQEALQTFLAARMELQPNQYSFGSVLSAIGAAESISLKHGQWCHSYLVKLGFNTDPVVSGALLDMYAKRGSISEALRVFREIPERSQVAWTAIISAYSRHGDYESVMSLFEAMERDAIKPDEITFLSVLTACGRKGMVKKGREIFGKMVEMYSIEPSSEHYSCLVDMLGRAGRLKEADEIASQIPGGPGFSVLQSLLGACKIHGNVEMGRRTADALMQMEPEDSGSYVLMSNLYAEKGDWQKVANLRKKMRDRGVKKEVGFSWVDVGDSDGSLYVHRFSSDDKSHSRSEEIYEMVESLGSEMKFLQRNEREVSSI